MVSALYYIRVLYSALLCCLTLPDADAKMRQMAPKIKPTHDITQNDKEFTIKIGGTPHNDTVKFTIGQEFKHKLPMFKSEFKVSNVYLLVINDPFIRFSI